MLESGGAICAPSISRGLTERNGAYDARNGPRVCSLRRALMAIERLLRRVFVGISLILVLPGGAYAQSAIAGVARDSTGAVLPGVTVEVASPALIEQTRSAVTDAQGQYKIIDLRPGTYSVTFALPGFSTVKREGVELPANFTATINGEL